MSLKEQINGLQHIGVPTKNMEETIAFYEKLGFETAFETVNDGDRVVFLKFASLVIETYESKDAAMKSGAVDQPYGQAAHNRSHPLYDKSQIHVKFQPAHYFLQ